ncbi:MAG: DNA-binding protein [Rhodoglobus sp.]|nr:DNA-binding protein [Rhodoglobus sp.]
MDVVSSAGELARFLPLSDIAELLSISTKQAYELVDTGELPAIRVGSAGHWRVERRVLEAYIEARYEESRRHALWVQSDFANVTALSFP